MITRLKFIVLSFILIVSMTGCASLGTFNPATGRSELIFISTPEEVSLGNNVHQQLAKQFTFSKDASKLNQVKRLGQRLTQVSDRQDYQYRFYVIDKDEMNAFTTPGGNIYVFTGLMDKLNSDDQLASVLAHEIGHCAARHTVKKYQAAMGYDLVGNILLGQVGGNAQRLVSMSSGVLMNLVFSAYGRKDEYEADRLGVKYLDQAGFDPNASIETLVVLQKESEGAGAPLVLRSHPHISDRISAAKKEIQQISSQKNMQ